MDTLEGCPVDGDIIMNFHNYKFVWGVLIVLGNLSLFELFTIVVRVGFPQLLFGMGRYSGDMVD